MPFPIQIGLFVGSVLGFLLLAGTLRKQQTWPALLLLAAPVCLALPLADWTMAGLGRVWSAAAMDGGAGDGWRFGFVFFVVLCAVELSTQLLLTRTAGTSVVTRPGDPNEVQATRPPPLPAPETGAPTA